MEQAPWWFASVMPVLGILIGVAVKWLVDHMTEKDQRRREDTFRFVSERRAAYIAFSRQLSAYLHSKRKLERLEAELTQAEERVATLEARSSEDSSTQDSAPSAGLAEAYRTQTHVMQAIKECLAVQKDFYVEYIDITNELDLYAPLHLADIAWRIDPDSPTARRDLRRFLWAAREDLGLPPMSREAAQIARARDEA